MRVNWKIIAALALILAAGAFLRGFRLVELPPGLYPDEAMNGNNALEAMRTGSYKPFYPENNGREGLFVNLEALTLAPLVSGGALPEAWMLRIPSVLFGILTILGIFFLARELFRRNGVALFAALLLATSFWHINFSRIAFRAIMAPCFLVWGVFLLLLVFHKLETKAFSEEQNPKHQTLNPKQIQNQNDKNSKPPAVSDFGHLDLFRIWNLGFGISALAILAGAVYGLGMHSYIAYRATPLLIVFIFILTVFSARGGSAAGGRFGWKTVLKVFGLFVTGAVIVALPLIVYFVHNPQDFFGRTSEISIFSAPSPAAALGVNVLKTAGMFFFSGDMNQRQNVAGAPELFWPVAILFAIGIIIGLWKLFDPNFKFEIKNSHDALAILVLFTWLITGALPEIFSNEGIPHALRAILMLPPAILLAAWGGERIYAWFRSKNAPRGFLVALVSLFVVALSIEAYTSYFVAWGMDPATGDAFAKGYVDDAETLNALPQELPKYVVVSASGVLVHGIPMPAETVMYLTDTYTPAEQAAKDLHYVLPSATSTIPQGAFVINLQ